MYEEFKISMINIFLEILEDSSKWNMEKELLKRIKRKYSKKLIDVSKNAYSF